MPLEDLRNSMIFETVSLVSSDFHPVVTGTNFVPTIDDPAITYPNLIDNEQGLKLLETCVLYVDLRESTRISTEHSIETLADIYSAYIRAMTRCAGYYGGKVRNIIGDRVMVVFDRENCFKNAVNTAILMNSVAQYVLNRYVHFDEMRCGIGIDYGKMLVTKTGIIKQGSENRENKSLVWLGRPANVASKLTDIAHKARDLQHLQVNVAYAPPGSSDWSWTREDVIPFIKKLKTHFTRVIHHESPLFASFFLMEGYSSGSNPPILMTQEVLTGLAREFPDESGLVNGWWVETDIQVPGYTGKIYGGDVIFTAFRDS